MKHSIKITALMLALMLTQVASLSAQSAPPPEKQERGGLMGKIFGQDAKTNQEKQQGKGAPASSSSKGSERLEPDDTNTLPTGVTDGALAGRRGQLSEEEAAVLPYYN